MKHVIGIILTFLIASEAMAQLTCKKGDSVLTGEIIADRATGPVLYGLKLNDDWSLDAEKTLVDIVDGAKNCKHLGSYIRMTADIRVCSGELFAFGGIYGQTILSEGSMKVLIEDLAPRSGWDCELD